MAQEMLSKGIGQHRRDYRRVEIHVVGGGGLSSIYRLVQERLDLIILLYDEEVSLEMMMYYDMILHWAGVSNPWGRAQVGSKRA